MPKMYTVLREGYGSRAFRDDFIAALTVVIVAIPLSMALAGVSGLVLRPFSSNDLLKHVTHVMGESQDFIDGPAYSGPDRRQKKGPDYIKQLYEPRARKKKDDA